MGKDFIRLNNLERRYMSAVRDLRPLAVREYAGTRGWTVVKLEGQRIWLLEHPDYDLYQLQIPMDQDDPGFTEGMWEVIRRLSELERRPPPAVISDLKWPDADILRVRVANRYSSSGQLPLAVDVQVRDGVRRALLASACSVVKPSRYHPRLSRNEADTLLNACQAGQTEVGSYVLKIVCPLHAVDDDELFEPFTRRVTTYLMRTVSQLVHRIENDELEKYETQQGGPTLSWNLCDALLKMQREADSGSVDIMTSWGFHRRVTPPGADDVPSRVSIKSDYMHEIEHVARVLRPDKASQQEELLIGTVETLKGEVGEGNRRSGEVHFLVLLPDGDGETFLVRAMLNEEQYEIAVRAHESGRVYVKLFGTLHRGQRIGRIDPLTSLSMLDGRDGSPLRA